MVGVGEPPLLLQWELTHAVGCALLQKHRGAALAITLLHAIIIAMYSLSVHAAESEREMLSICEFRFPVRLQLQCVAVIIFPIPPLLSTGRLFARSQPACVFGDRK
jgi:hypothetical protein